MMTDAKQDPAKRDGEPKPATDEPATDSSGGGYGNHGGEAEESKD